MGIGSFIKAKLLITIVAGVVFAGGATAAFAATPTGQNILHALSDSSSITATSEPNDPGHNNHAQACPGLPDAQRLAAKFSLNTDSKSDDVQAICALHTGKFSGKQPDGSTVSSSQIFGYGEIAMLLTYARYLATHDNANTSGKLTSDNARSYLAVALHSCGATPLEKCLKTNIPGYQSGNTGTGTSNGADNGTENSNRHGNGSGGKPDSTPTPPTPRP